MPTCGLNIKESWLLMGPPARSPSHDSSCEYTRYLLSSLTAWTSSSQVVRSVNVSLKSSKCIHHVPSAPNSYFSSFLRSAVQSDDPSAYLPFHSSVPHGLRTCTMRPAALDSTAS